MDSKITKTTDHKVSGTATPINVKTKTNLVSNRSMTQLSNAKKGSRPVSAARNTKNPTCKSRNTNKLIIETSTKLQPSWKPQKSTIQIVSNTTSHKVDLNEKIKRNSIGAKSLTNKTMSQKSEQQYHNLRGRIEKEQRQSQDLQKELQKLKQK